MTGTLKIHFSGEEFTLHPDRILWWPVANTLLLADVHLGKSATFREHGLQIPEGGSDTDLQRLGEHLAAFRPTDVIVVGDLFHSPDIGLERHLDQLQKLLEEHRCTLHLVLGNHDPRASRLHGHDRIICHPEYISHGLHFVHDPAHAAPDAPTVCGHVHPMFRIGAKHRPSKRVPCFAVRRKSLVLPAFGTFTAGRLLDHIEADMFYPIAGSKVFIFPGKACNGEAQRQE